MRGAPPPVEQTGLPERERTGADARHRAAHVVVLDELPHLGIREPRAARALRRAPPGDHDEVARGEFRPAGLGPERQALGGRHVGLVGHVPQSVRRCPPDIPRLLGQHLGGGGEHLRRARQIE
ncbi:MAG TPA: hypothetical protein VHG10_01915 [Glycomyces sp.]|nr:hypothetical protein [Glycomyces sp.]